MKWILMAGLIAIAGLAGCQTDTAAHNPAMIRESSWEAFQERNKEALAADSPTEKLSETPSLRECLLYATRNNLRLQAAFYRWQAALEQVPQAQALPNPKVSYSYFFQRVETRVGSQRQGLALQQTFPAWGKIQSRTDAASATAKARWQEFQGEKFSIYARIQKEWGDLYYAQKELSLTQEQLTLLEQFEPVLRQRYRTSQAAQADLLRLQVDIDKIRDRIETLQKRLVPLGASLNRVLGRPVSLPISISQFPEQQMMKLDEPHARMALARQNPFLLASRMKIQAAEENINLARADQLPDVTVGVSWIDTVPIGGPNAPSGDGKDPVIGTVSLSLPVWFQATQAGIRQAQHLRNEVDRNYQALVLETHARLEEAIFQLDDSQRRLKLYKNALLPKAAESWKVTQRQYINNLASYNDMIETLQTLLEFELALERARVRRLAATGTLQELTTLSIEELALRKNVSTPASMPASAPAKTPEP